MKLLSENLNQATKTFLVVANFDPISSSHTLGAKSAAATAIKVAMNQSLIAWKTIKQNMMLNDFYGG